MDSDVTEVHSQPKDFLVGQAVSPVTAQWGRLIACQVAGHRPAPPEELSHSIAIDLLFVELDAEPRAFERQRLPAANR
jgi:hypothetical protein